MLQYGQNWKNKNNEISVFTNPSNTFPNDQNIFFFLLLILYTQQYKPALFNKNMI